MHMLQLAGADSEGLYTNSISMLMHLHVCVVSRVMFSAASKCLLSKI